MQSDGADIQLIADAGSIGGGFQNFVLDASAAEGSGGNVLVDASDGIVLVNVIDASGGLDGGDVTLVTDGAILSTANVSVDARGITGVGGTVDITSAGGAALNGVTAQGAAGGGDITITSLGDLVQVGQLDASADSGFGGNVQVSGEQGILATSIFTDVADFSPTGDATAGTIDLNSTNGSIEFALGSFLLASSPGTSGDVTFSASGELIIETIDNRAGTGGSGEILLEGADIAVPEGAESGALVLGTGVITARPFDPAADATIGNVDPVAGFDLTVAELEPRP